MKRTVYKYTIIGVIGCRNSYFLNIVLCQWRMAPNFGTQAVLYNRQNLGLALENLEHRLEDGKPRDLTLSSFRSGKENNILI